MEHKVFVYGILKTGAAFDSPPSSVPGTLYCRSIALARFDDTDHGAMIQGEVRTVGSDTLKDWDRLEGVAHGMYSRIRVTTIDGERCWAYQYEQSLRGAHVIGDGVWRGC